MEAGLISASQIEIALKEQQLYNMKIGEIFALHNWIKQKTADFFVDKLPYLAKENQKKPIAYYFQEAGLLTEEQINDLIKLQKRKEKKIRFHNLAVEQGYVKQLTVDFFLAHIFNIYNPHNCSFTDVYQLLKNYNDGQTNFQKVELKKAPLIGVSLKGVQLDGSNLREANLKSSNLSNSSMIQVNLALATLTKAVLTNVNLERACLTKANLKEAYLDQANFQGANLRGANLQEAYLFQASFVAADLRNAQLSSVYNYEVYYDRQTRFDNNFDPQQAGWKLKN